jgi:hypothetical protein
LLAGLHLKDLGFSRVCKLQASNFHFRPNPKSIQIAEDSTRLTKMGCEEEITKVCIGVVVLLFHSGYITLLLTGRIGAFG